MFVLNLCLACDAFSAQSHVLMRINVNNDVSKDSPIADNTNDPAVLHDLDPR